MQIDRGATAIRRNATSRPLALLLANGLVAANDRVLDFGCGYGEDVDHLRQLGHDAVGWDPHHRPEGPLEPADVVLCSYVLNVIEKPSERLEALRQVWDLAHRVVLVSVRTTAERRLMEGCTVLGDGWLTSRNTFQTLWSQAEARQLLESSFDAPPIALAPGVFAVFKTQSAEEAWREEVGDRLRRAKIRRGTPIHRPGVLEQLYDDHREAFDWLWTWTSSRGRLPEDDELDEGMAEAVDAAGSIGRAGLVLRQVHDPTPVRRAGKRELLYGEHQEAFDALLDWALMRGRLPDDDEVPKEAEKAVVAAGSVGHAGQVLRAILGDDPLEEAAAERRQALATRFAIARLRRRPRFSDLPATVQRDVRRHFGSYKSACVAADTLLFAVGDTATLAARARRSAVGKLTSDALYVHRSALSALDAELQVYEACAAVLAGVVDGANIIKLHLDKPRVSYLVYPDFDDDPHPALTESWVADLRQLDLRPTDYRERANPPVLHRKELFVTEDHPRRETFRRLTEQEERHGLLDDAHKIGTRVGWSQRLQEAGWELRGHRLVRCG